MLSSSPSPDEVASSSWRDARLLVPASESVSLAQEVRWEAAGFARVGGTDGEAVVREEGRAMRADL